MALNIDEYRKYIIDKRKFTQNPSEYVMEVFGGGDNLICYPDSFLLPGRNFINTPFSYTGAEFTFPLRREYNELSVNFIVYQDWVERLYFEKWMDSIFPSQGRQGSSNTVLIPDSMVSNFDTKLRTIKIRFNNRPPGNGRLSDEGKSTTVTTFEFSRCYPLLITPINFSADNSGYTIFSVNFSVLDYSIKELDYDTPIGSSISSQSL
jgi:hypothetical protein